MAGEGAIELEIEGFSKEEITAMVTDVLRVGERAIELTAIEVWGNVKEESPVDQGLLAGSWQLAQSAPMEWRIYTGVAYALDVHEGTDPGPRPFGPIEDWALRKGLPPGPIWQSIQRHGTRANPFVDRAIDETSRRTDEFIARAMREVMGG